MSTLIVAAALAIVFIVSLIILIMTTEAAPLRMRAMKRASITVLILGAFALSTACSTTQSGTGTKGYSAGKQGGYVKRAMFTTAIKNREPIDKISKLGNDQRKRICRHLDHRGRGSAARRIRHRNRHRSGRQHL